MARPKKTGLDYFPKDVDTWDDYKIMDLVNEYGPLGYCIYDIARDEVYKNGYYLEVPLDRLAVLIIRKIGNRWVKDKNLVLQVIQYCADIGLFHNALLTQSVITSVGIQKRYSEVTVRNKADKSKYWLLEKNDSHAGLKTASQKTITAVKTAVSETEKQVNASVIPQKESKVNKSKANERKVCMYEIPCRDGEFTIDEEYYSELTHTYKDMDISLSLRQLQSYMLSNPDKQRYLKGAKGCVEWWLSSDNNAGRYRKKKQNYTYDIERYEETNAIFEDGFL